MAGADSNPQVIEHLNGVLADAVVYYYKLHNYHWFVTGVRFDQLHRKFEELYENAHIDIDELAERVLTIGGKPIGTLATAIKTATVAEETQTPDAETMLDRVVNDLRTRRERSFATIAEAENAGDRGTVNMLDEMNDRIEKQIWMIEAMR